MFWYNSQRFFGFLFTAIAKRSIFARNLPKLLKAALKDKKSYHNNMKEFQTTAIELCKQPKILKQKKEYIRLVIVSIGVDVVTKIDSMMRFMF